MEIPVVFEFLGNKASVHFIFETLAFFIAFRYYIFLKRKQKDTIDSINRLYIILGATIGALIGSRLLGALEDPKTLINLSFIQIYKSKTIIGGLLGGLLVVELTKKILGEKQSSGDLFVFPLILGIFIGRIGCFLTGTIEPTYGIETNFFMGMDLGDGIKRHPTALYEMIFLIFLFFFLKKMNQVYTFKNGSLFKLFMISYFLFRFLIEYIKPNTFFLFGFSSIQLSCVFCFLYYGRFILKPKLLLNYA